MVGRGRLGVRVQKVQRRLNIAKASRRVREQRECMSEKDTHIFVRK